MKKLKNHPIYNMTLKHSLYIEPQCPRAEELLGELHVMDNGQIKKGHVNGLRIYTGSIAIVPAQYEHHYIYFDDGSINDVKIKRFSSYLTDQKSYLKSKPKYTLNGLLKKLRFKKKATKIKVITQELADYFNCRMINGVEISTDIKKLKQQYMKIVPTTS